MSACVGCANGTFNPDAGATSCKTSCVGTTRFVFFVFRFAPRSDTATQPHHVLPLSRRHFFCGGRLRELPKGHVQHRRRRDGLRRKLCAGYILQHHGVPALPGGDCRYVRCLLERDVLYEDWGVFLLDVPAWNVFSEQSNPLPLLCGWHFFDGRRLLPVRPGDLR
jgi:hypothetical protein